MMTGEKAVYELPQTYVCGFTVLTLLLHSVIPTLTHRELRGFVKLLQP